MWSEKARHNLDAMEVIQKKLKFHISITGLIEKEWAKLNPGKKKILISQVEYDRLEEDKQEGKYSSEKIESYFTLFESLLAPQVKTIIGCRRIMLCQARFYGLWRISYTCCENCQKMQIPLH